MLLLLTTITTITATTIITTNNKKSSSFNQFRNIYSMPMLDIQNHYFKSSQQTVNLHYFQSQEEEIEFWRNYCPQVKLCGRAWIDQV